MVAVVEGLLVLKVVDAVVRQPIVARVGPPAGAQKLRAVQRRNQTRGLTGARPPPDRRRRAATSSRTYAAHTHAGRQQQKRTEKNSAPAKAAESRAAHMSAAEVSGMGSMKTQNVALAEL